MSPSPSTTISAQPGPQTAFLQTAADICIYGGAAGGGEDRRTDPGAAAPRRPRAGLYRGILPPHHTADHQSRRVMGREPKLLSAAWWHPAPARARMALATRRQDQVFASPAWDYRP